MDTCIEENYNKRIFTSNLKGYNIDRMDNRIEVHHDERLITIGEGSAVIQQMTAFESFVGFLF